MTIALPAFHDRRRVIFGLMLAPVGALAACQMPLGPVSVGEGVRHLLTLSSQRAFARLTEPGGFYDDQLTRIAVPDLGNDRSSAALAAVLRTRAVRERVAMTLNDIAIDAADRATPVVLDSIRRMSFADAVAVLRGGPTAATQLLERETGGQLVHAMFPEVSSGLRGDGMEILTAALAGYSGFDLSRLADGVTRQVSAAIFRAIGREESGIRADPRSTRDPVLIGLLAG